MQDVVMQGLEFIKALVPVRTEIIVGAGASVMGAITNYLLGGVDDLLVALLVFMIIDYVTGIIAAWMLPGTKLDSHKSYKGLWKKFLILCVVCAGHIFGHITGQEIIRTIIIWFYLGNEGLSILENIANCGVPIPNKVKENLAQYAQEKNQNRPAK